MDFGWYPLLVGIAFGLIPHRWLYAKGYRHLTLLEVRSSAFRVPGGSSGGNRRRRRWWKTPLVLLDPFRGYASAHFCALGLAAIPATSPLAAALMLVGQCVIIAAVLITQMESGRQGANQIIAPVAFLFGFTTGLYLDFGIIGGAVAVIGVTTMIAAHSFTWGYLTAGAAAVLIGFSFLGLSPSLIVFAVTAGAPVPYAFLRRAKLVYPLRG
jgi:hypothetical protein